jgi:hypothetical protein
MGNQRRSRRRRVTRLLGEVTCLALLWCSGGCEPLRQVLYPPTFRYTSRDTVRDTMRAVAVQVDALDETLRDESLVEEERAERASSLLLAIEGAASSLRGAGEPTNHLLLDANLDRFLADVRLARQSAEARPPSLLLAANVAGACRYCHGPR